LAVGSGSTDVVLVAVLDTGIDQQHEDLAGKVVGTINFSDSQIVSDRPGHGTHVAGIIAATDRNGIGIAGAAPNARLLNVKIADDNGMVWASTVAKGIVWAVDNGAKIINMSLAIPATTPALEEAVNYAWSRGVVIIAAAGNTGSSVPTYPASCPNVIAVAATDINGSLWDRSNHGDWVSAYAPGAEIYSALPGNSYGYKSGTSMATAYVTAVAALTLSTVTDVDGDGLVNDEVTEVLKTVFALPQ
jgi:thermitase